MGLTSSIRQTGPPAASGPSDFTNAGASPSRIQTCVSGGCFPSAHVSGTWALTCGLYVTRSKAAPVFALAAVGLSVACVYTRYHHGVDIAAGFVVGIAGGMLGALLTRRARSGEGPPAAGTRPVNS